MDRDASARPPQPVWIGLLSTFTHLLIRADRFEQRVVVWVSPLEMA
jgi:hypothetical protein